MSEQSNSLISLPRPVKLAVLVAALGYFVDAFDLLLFSVLRVQSLQDLGLTGDEILNTGKDLINCQMWGLLIGGVIWGVLGDKIGRIQVLFGSIITYSVATFLNAFVQDVSQYAILRFIAGIGLAGELGGGITLVAELLPKDKRGLGATIVTAIGVSGVVAAGIVGKLLPWRQVYILGGIMGLLLLLLRVSVSESGIFNSIRDRDIKKGDFLMILTSAGRLYRYCCCIATAIPAWFVVGILMTFCAEIGAAKGISEPLVAADAFMWCYIGMTAGDFTCGLFSQKLKSRKKAILYYLIMEVLLLLCIFLVPLSKPSQYYLLSALAGFFIGYWVIFVTTAAEQFGTNLRATVATTVPNFVRASAIPMTSSFVYLKANGYGVLQSAALVGVVATVLGFVGALSLKESFHLDLDYIEEH